MGIQALMWGELCSFQFWIFLRIWSSCINFILVVLMGASFFVRFFLVEDRQGLFTEDLGIQVVRWYLSKPQTSAISSRYAPHSWCWFTDLSIPFVIISYIIYIICFSYCFVYIQAVYTFLCRSLVIVDQHQMLVAGLVALSRGSSVLFAIRHSNLETCCWLIMRNAGRLTSSSLT